MYKSTVLSTIIVQVDLRYNKKQGDFYMTTLLDIAKKRYSVRKYEDKPVEKEKLEKILTSAHVAFDE